MSRGFVKEDDQEEIPFVLPRAYLPEGVTNYVTKVGINALLNEKQVVLNERAQLDTYNEKDRRIALNHINARLQLLTQRIATAKVVDLSGQPQNEVRFGATVTLKLGAINKVQIFQIVGVDEADIAAGKIAFISPMAKILINKKIGDKTVLKLAREERVFEIMNITYRE